jgi:GT2 family glycosyltransferase
MSVCAIIVTWNKKNDVMRLLDQLKDIYYPPDKLEILVVDNHSSDGTAEAIASAYPEVILIRNQENLGGTGGFNTGMRWVLENRPECEFLWLLDNDVLVDKKALISLVRVMNKNPRAAICGSKIMDIDVPDRLIEIGAFIDYSTGDIRTNVPDPALLSNPDAVFEVDYVAACSLLARTAYIKDAGLWHEAFFIYWDDMEWGARFKSLGYQVLASNASIVWHPSWAGRTSDGSEIWRCYYRSRNALAFFNHYSGGGMKRRLLLAKMLLRFMRFATGDAIRSYSALSEAYFRGIRDFFAGSYGKKTFRMPSADLEAYFREKENRNVCVFVHSSEVSDRIKKFVSDLAARYSDIKVTAVLPENIKDQWTDICHKNDIITYRRIGRGIIPLKDRYRMMKFLKSRSWNLLLCAFTPPKLATVWGRDIARINFDTGRLLAIEKINFRQLCWIPFLAGYYLLRTLLCPSKKGVAGNGSQGTGHREQNRLPDEAYRKWLKKVSPDISFSKDRIEAMSEHPFFSVIVPTYNSNILYFDELIESLKAQTYPFFEVCISDDGSTDEILKNYLTELSESDSRFRVMLSDTQGGIAVNTNRAMKTAKGDFLIFCDHDDRIEPFALELVAGYINARPDADLIYSDEDMIDEKGFRHTPRLQPDWNPDLLTSHMYCPHLITVRTSLAGAVGFMDPAMDGAQDYDFFLRASEKAKHIGHIPMILYSWRSAKGSIASDCSEKLYAYEAGRTAIENAMKRRGEEAVVLKSAATHLGVYRIKRKVSEYRVTHIVEGRTQEVLTAIKSIRLVSQFPVNIVVVAEDGNDELLGILERDADLNVLTVPKGSGRAVFYNRGADAAESGVLFFSADTVEILDSEYPTAALEHAQRPDIGAVGMKIIYPNGRFYHTGMVLGVNGLFGYAHRNILQGPGYFNSAICIKNYSSVSWDLMAIDKGLWEKAGGFDESLSFYGDADFCLKLISRGYRNIYTPYISGVLKRKVHLLEELRNDEAAAVLMERYGDMIQNDPYYHPLLTKELEDFSRTERKII